MLGGYYGAGPWQERLKLSIIGKLTEKLSVSYDLEQQPDMPDKFDVKVTYDKTQLTFGDFQANFGGNEFVSTSKYLNGVMITSRDNWYDLTFVPSSKLKSETQQLVSQKGNNSKGPYSLGHGSIIEDSERVELNNVLQKRGIDYTIDYFSGKITFSRILIGDDTFTYSYEFTNVLDMFFPTVSKRDFVGLQASVIVDPTLLGAPAKKMEKAVREKTEFFPSILQSPEEISTKEVIIMPTQVRIVTPTIEGAGYVLSVNNVPVIIFHEISGEPLPIERSESAKRVIEDAVTSGIASAEISISMVNSNEVLMVKGEPVATASKGESASVRMSSGALANKWKMALIAGLSSTSETMEISDTFEAQPKESEWESTGTYKLGNTPIVPYSENISYKGARLKKFEDYLIDYQEGSITLLSPTLPTSMDPLTVTYQFVEVAAESETLPGSGKGPYSLAHEDIIDGSEMVYVNNIPYVRELDYKIDYKLGKIIFFTNIPQTANIVIKYKHLVFASTPTPVVPVVPRSLKLGVSYLKESGKRGATAPTINVTQTKSGKDINENSSLVYLDYRPVPSTSEVEVRRNNLELVYGIDFLFPTVEASTGSVIPPTKLAYLTDKADRSDGLKTGTIRFLSSLATTDEVTISYSYSKWSQDRYSGSGAGSSLTYYLGNFRNLVPGAEEVQIWRKNVTNPMIKKITRNSSIEVYDGHYSINYTDPPSITFNSDPIVVDGETFYLNDINFTVMIKFVAQASISERPIAHDVLGLDANFMVGDHINLEGSFARSKTDQIFQAVSTSESFNGDSVNRIFNLKSPGEILDGSEQVYLNNQKLNRDDQYAFFYDSNSSGKYGVLTFFTLTPTTLDAISVDYSYQDILGTVTKLSEKQGSAYRVAGRFKPSSNMEFAADYKKVDSEFAPMGGISVPLGSDYKHFYSKLLPLPSVIPSLWMSGDVKESNVPLSNRTDKFLHSYDRNVNTGFDTLGLAQIDLGIRDYSTIDDLLPGSNIHTNDYKSSAYSISIAPRSLSLGEFAWTNRNDARRTEANTDTSDKILPRDSISEYFHTNNAFDLTRRFKFVVDYQKNLPQTVSYESGTRAPSRSHVIERQTIEDKSYYLNSDLNYWSFKRLYAYINRLEHEENVELPAKALRSTLNETYHLDFVPIDQVATSYDQNRQETPSITTKYGNPKTERKSMNVRVTPYSTTGLGWSGSLDDSLQESGIRTSGRANTYSIDHVPFSGSNYKVLTKFGLSSSIRTGPLGNDLAVTTDTRTFSQDYGITYSPLSILSLTTGFNQEDYTNKNNASVTPVDTKSQAQTIRAGSLYKATNDLDVSANYSIKVTSTTVPDQLAAQKTMMDAHAVYKAFTYGTLNYDWNQEDNGGEVLGGTFVNQDFIKIIQALSLNFVVPQQEQMILSSIVLRAAVKWSNYQDRINSVNSFGATLLTFEGTFNF